MNLELQDDAHNGELAPLSSDMKREIYELKAAYEEFWQQRKFKKGWAKPLFAFDETVDELLAQAAEIVVRIRSHFDEITSGTGVGTGAGVVLSKSAPALATHTKRLPRFKEGRAREQLWSLEQDPHAAPQQFVRDIVHATLSHEDGYLEEGLTADKVDRYIDKILAYMKQRDQQEAQATAQLEEKLKRRWAKTEKLLQAFCELEADRKANKSHYGSLRKIIKRVDDVHEELKLMLSRADTNASRPAQVVEEQQASETPGTETQTPAAQPTTEKGEEQPEAANIPVEEVKEEEDQTTDESVATAEPVTDEAETPKPETAESAQPEAAAESEVTTKPEATETTESEASEAAPSEEVKQTEGSGNKEESSDDNSSSSSDEERQRIEQEKQKAMLKIKSVADSVTRLSDQIEGFASEATRLDVEELQKEPESAEKTLSRLQKQCLSYSENLMKDLLSLDAISTGTALQDEASDEVRPLRKQQVKEIQGLLQDVDQVNTKLKAMLKKIQDEKQRREEQRKKLELDERAKQPQQQQPQQPQQQQQEKGEDQQTTNMWRTLKLKPKFEMAQTVDGIVLQAYIPGMKEEDIEIERDDDGRTFTVKGLRVPTPAEEAALRRQLQSGLARDPWGLYYPQGEQERDLLLRLGAGRYGTFAETFEVGPEMDIYGITASYTKGVLRILVPADAAAAAAAKRRPRGHPQRPHYQQHQQPLPYGGPQQRRRHPAAAHRGGYGGAPQGFFDDKSFWW